MLLNGYVSVGLLYELSFFPTAKVYEQLVLSNRKAFWRKLGPENGKQCQRYSTVSSPPGDQPTHPRNCAAEWESVLIHCTSWAVLARAGSVGPHPFLYSWLNFIRFWLSFHIKQMFLLSSPRWHTGHFLGWLLLIQNPTMCISNILPTHLILNFPSWTSSAIVLPNCLGLSWLT